MLSNNDLRQICTFNDAVSQLAGIGAIGQDQYDQMTGFGILPGERKPYLVGIPFVIVQLDFKVGKYESSFVDCHIVTTSDERMIIRDSSQGIHEQLKEIVADRTRAGHVFPHMGIYIRKGLLPRENSYELPDGSKSTSTTYYLNGIHYSRAGEMVNSA